MSSVSFWTPVRYAIQPTTLPQKAREWVDGYFSLGKKAAFVYENHQASDSAILVPIKTAWWKTTLKVTSYTAFFLFRAANLLFPGLPLIPEMVVLQTVISCLPIVMLVMKAVLRSRYFPHLNEQPGFILPQIKKTLDMLLGRSFDQLPVYTPGWGEHSPSVANMPHPIMRSRKDHPHPFILIKIKQPYGEAKILQLYQSPTGNLLEWRQEYASRAHFFTSIPSPSRSDAYVAGTFTSAECGNVLASEEENFTRLQKLMQEGKGVDSNGAEWEIDDPILPQVKAILDQLLGHCGPVDQLPIHQVPKERNRPNIEEMEHPIMRCDGYDSAGVKNSCIAMKVKSIEHDYEKLWILSIPFGAPNPLRWGQLDSTSRYYPSFFDSDFIKAGNIEPSQLENFKRLQTFIQEGNGKDRNGKEWEIMQKSKEIDS